MTPVSQSAPATSYEFDVNPLKIENEPLTLRTGDARANETLSVRLGEEDVSMIRLPLQDRHHAHAAFAKNGTMWIPKRQLLKPISRRLLTLGRPESLGNAAGHDRDLNLD